MNAQESFDPYREWLGLDLGGQEPDHYRLLALEPDVDDVERIAAAADRAATRVRSARPGSHAPAWARLLDRIAEAKRCLTDPASKAEYDRKLGDVAGKQASGTERAQPGSPSQWPPSASAPSPAVSPAIPAAPASGFSTLPGIQPPSPLDPMAPYDEDAAWGASQASGWSTGAAEEPGGASHAADGAAVPLGSPVVGSPVPSGNHLGSDGSQASAWSVPGVESVPMGTPVAAVPLGSSVSQASSSPASSSPALNESGHSSVTAARRSRQHGSAWTVGAIGAVSIVSLAAVLLVMLGGGKSSRQVAGGRSPASRPLKPTGPGSEPAVTTSQGQPVLGGGQAAQGPAGTAGGPVGGMPAEQAGTEQPTTDRRGEPARQAPPAGMAPDPRIAPQPAESPAAVGEDPDMAFPSVPEPAMPEIAMPEPTVSAPGPGSGPGSTDTEAGERPAGAGEPQQVPEPAMPGKDGKMATESEDVPAAGSEPAARQPSAEELAALAEALRTARTALGEQNFDVADEQLTKARELARLPEHRAKLKRLEQLAHYVRGFWDAVERAVSGFEGTEEFTVGSTVVVVVEASQESITIKFNGLRRKYPIRQLPPGLAVAIADQWFDPSKPENLVFKGAYVAVMRNADEQDQAKGRGWWEQAIAQGVDIRALLPVYDDTYDFGG